MSLPTSAFELSPALSVCTFLSDLPLFVSFLLFLFLLFFIIGLDVLRHTHLDGVALPRVADFKKRDLHPTPLPPLPNCCFKSHTPQYIPISTRLDRLVINGMVELAAFLRYLAGLEC